jgi:hypothetical protein
MFFRFHVQLALAFAVSGGITGSILGEEPKTLVPTAIELKSTPCGDGWKRWDSIGRIDGMFRERITALVASGNDVWVGTSYGRLLTQRNDGWILQGRLDGTQITGISPPHGGVCMNRQPQPGSERRNDGHGDFCRRTTHPPENCP